jgi:hypothetical protein
LAGEQEASFLKLLSDRFASHKDLFARIRDIAIVFLPAIYILGYLTWSVNAYNLGLGALPALNEQYLMSGLFPAAIMTIVYALHRFGVYHTRRLDDSLPSKYRRIHRAIRTVVSALALCFLVAVAKMPEDVLGSDWESTAVGWELASIFALCMLCFVFPASSAEDQHMESRTRFKIRLLLLPLFLLLVGLYVSFSVVTYVPSAFGGLQPRCARLDVVVAELSKDSRWELGFPTAMSEDSVQRTPNRVRVLYIGDRSAALELVGSSKGPFELKVELITSVFWQEC